MQHQVPQFIDVEDKIFGPLTAKQAYRISNEIRHDFGLLVKILPVGEEPIK